MIPKTCPLNDRYRLQTTLRADCLVSRALAGCEHCEGCSYRTSSERERQTEYIKSKLAQMKTDRHRETRARELKERLMREKGIR